MTDGLVIRLKKEKSEQIHGWVYRLTRRLAKIGRLRRGGRQLAAFNGFHIMFIRRVFFIPKYLVFAQ